MFQVVSFSCCDVLYYYTYSRTVSPKSLKEVFRRDKDNYGSPLSHLLKSNTTPSDSEIITIRALIADAEIRMEKLHSSFPTHNRAFQAEKSRLLKFIEAHKTLTSPVRYLPSEILQEIFLHYADTTRIRSHSKAVIMFAMATVPWRLGHICHRWRKVALSFPSLWDDIPQININETFFAKRSYTRALTCLIQRSGTSCTLKFDITNYGEPKVYEAPIIQEIMHHSERIAKLRIVVDEATMQPFQGFKGRLQNLRILRLYYLNWESRVPNQVDIFETAPALRHVTLEGPSCQPNNCKILLPWSQIGVQYPPLVVIDKGDCQQVDLFSRSLILPLVQAMKIFCMGPFIPCLVSAFSGSYGPSRLQKLAFRTLPLQTGELTALLSLTPDLVELDIVVPPAADILRLTYSEGKVMMLVPKLQVLYMHSPVLPMSTRTGHFNTLAQVRCKLDPNREDATKPTWTRLHTLRFVFDSAGSRDCSEKVLNNWCQSIFTPEETKAIDMLSRCGDYIRGYALQSKTNTTAHLKVMFDELLDCTENYQVTINVLHDTNIHITLRRYFLVGLMKLPDQADKYKMIRKVKHILAKWDQLLLTDLCDYRWVRTSHDYSLVYLPKGDFHVLKMAPDAGLRSIVYGLELHGRFKEVLWNRYPPPPQPERRFGTLRYF